MLEDGTHTAALGTLGTLGTLGLSVTHQITSQVERALERKGIKPGADGFDLHLQMDRIVCNDLPP
jgi:hypothetical protein